MRPWLTRHRIGRWGLSRRIWTDLIASVSWLSSVAGKASPAPERVTGGHKGKGPALPGAGMVGNEGETDICRTEGAYGGHLAFFATASASLTRRKIPQMRPCPPPRRSCRGAPRCPRTGRHRSSFHLGPDPSLGRRLAVGGVLGSSRNRREAPRPQTCLGSDGGQLLQHG